MNGCDGGGRVKGQGCLAGHLHLGTAHVLFLEQELTVEVAHFNRVQIDLNQIMPQFNTSNFMNVAVESFTEDTPLFQVQI